jgi:hypothetical protein
MGGWGKTKKNYSQKKIRKKKIPSLEDTELPSLTAYQKRKKGRAICCSNKGSRANFAQKLDNMAIHSSEKGGGGGRQY